MGIANFSPPNPDITDEQNLLENFFSTDQTDIPTKTISNIITFPDGIKGQLNKKSHRQAESMNHLMTEYMGLAHSVHPAGIFIAVLLDQPPDTIMYQTVLKVTIDDDPPKEIKWMPDKIWIAKYSEDSENALFDLTSFLESLGLSKTFNFSLSRDHSKILKIHERTKKIEMTLPKTKDELIKFLEKAGNLLNIDLLLALQLFLDN